MSPTAKITSRQWPVFSASYEKSRMVMEFDPYDTLIINSGNHILILFHLNCNSKHELSTILIYRVFSLTWQTPMQIYWNKRKPLHKKRVQLPKDSFGTPTWPPFHCFGIPIWPPSRHVKTLYSHVSVLIQIIVPAFLILYLRKPRRDNPKIFCKSKKKF